MTNWYLNAALTGLRKAVDERWPDRDRKSDGTIGDEAHQARSSDHNPDADGSVDAWDMDVDGVEVWTVIKAFEAHPSSGYWIYDDEIASRASGWRRRSYAYAGPKRSRHTEHVHLNTRPAEEDSVQPWHLDEPGTKPTGKPKTVKPHGSEPGARQLKETAPAMHGEDVVFVQQWIGPHRCGPADGVYGPQTARGVEWYQRMRGVHADGVVGPQTWAQMGVG